MTDDEAQTCRLLVFELTPTEARNLAFELEEPRGSRVRIGFECGQVKVDAGWGWTAPMGTAAQPHECR